MSSVSPCVVVIDTYMQAGGGNRTLVTSLEG
jgi:hypothetical protein